MKGRIIFPKKSPGFAIVRTTPTVNDGVVNNILAKKSYATTLAGSNRIGVLTGKTATQQVEGYTYVWYQVTVPVLVFGKVVNQTGWVREDAFSYQYNNTEVQQDPKAQRLAYAKQQAAAVQTAVNSTAKALQGIEKAVAAKKGKLTSEQRKGITQIRQQHESTMLKLGKVPGIKLTPQTLSGVDGLGLVPLVIVAIVVVSAVVAAYGINQWVQWSSTMKQIEGEAATQRQLIDTYMGILNSPTATTEQKAAAQTQLDTINQASQDRAAKLAEQTADNSFGSQISKAILPIGLLFIGAKAVGIV
jgi:hypothetical protein